jgi:aspartyl-tRNA(Asn)/glutamyl-tRNA(Gln) amidotransferase subunit A
MSASHSTPPAGIGNQRPLWSHSLAEAAAAMRSGAAMPADYVEACISRVDDVDGCIHSYLHLAADEARRQARKLAAAPLASAGPLHGLPFGVKATYDVAGWPSGSGSRLRRNRIAPRDARLVEQVRAQGAICLGLLNTWEYGTGNGGEYFDLPFPPARNPWDTERFTGGSSSGCGASVIAGTSLFALGSDTTGSVRLPAGATGAVGLIPTQGRFSLDGILPNCYSLDTPGTFTRTAEDAATLFNVLAPAPARVPDAAQLRAQGVRGMRVAVVSDPGVGFPQADRALRTGFEQALGVLTKLGATFVDVELPATAAECLSVTRLIGPVESASIHEQELRERASEMGFALRDKLLAGSLVRAVDYLAALRRRAEIAQQLHALLADFDALVTFGTLHLPPRLGVEPEMTAFTVETMLTPFNLAGLPALVQCTGFSGGERPLPLHWQVVGRAGSEAAVLRLAIAYEQATAWREQLPQPTAYPKPAPQLPDATGDEASLAEVSAFAARHGLGQLAPAHLERMRALVEPVARTGHVLHRVTAKERGPALQPAPDAEPVPIAPTRQSA